MTISFSDAPAIEDNFEIEDYTEGLSKFIMNCSTPLTLAIQGDWGTGKTSIMNQVEKKLTTNTNKAGEKKIKSIFFNTWQYSQFEMGNDLAVMLITDLILALEESEEERKKILKKVGNFLLKGLTSLKVDVGIINWEQITEKLQDVAQDFGKRNNDIKNLKMELENFIKNVKNKKQYDKVVIFIDDLDRLPPEKAVELLEILKLFLDCEHCVYVLAIDYAVVVRGTKKKYGDDLDDEKGKAFFDKIIQVPFSVPVAYYKMDKYIKSLLGKLDFDFKDNNDAIGKATRLIINSIGNNLRSIKRLFNSVGLLMCINGNKGEGNQNRETLKDKLLMLAVVCFQLRFEKAYNYILSSYNSSPDDSDEIMEYLITLLENNFTLPEEEDFNTQVFIYGECKLENHKDSEDFPRFYRSLKELFEIGDESSLTVEQFEMLLEKMRLSNVVATGNMESGRKKQIQDHSPNEDVQYVIRKLFNRLANEEHFDLTKPEKFGKEKKKDREIPIGSEFRIIDGEYDKIRLTQGKGQGINIFSEHNKKIVFIHQGMRKEDC